MDISCIAKETIFKGPVSPVYQPKMIRSLCRAPYYGHVCGCPNFGVKLGCPPQVPVFEDLFQPEVYLVAVKFDFGTYLENKSLEHPDWTLQALKNPRHWQGHVRSTLRHFAQTKRGGLPGYVLITNPEGMGINVTETCRNIEIMLEWPPRKTVYQIYMLAKPKTA